MSIAPILVDKKLIGRHNNRSDVHLLWEGMDTVVRCVMWFGGLSVTGQSILMNFYERKQSNVPHPQIFCKFVFKFLSFTSFVSWFSKSDVSIGNTGKVIL